VVIIIDALDEGHAHQVEHVLKVLRDEVPKLPGTFRVLLTTQNTPDLDFYLSDQPHVRRLSIDTSEQTNLHDIAIYSQHKLQDIQAPTNPFERQGLIPTGYTETHKKFKLHNLNLPSLS
jgi:hypothetical protein